jgi:hypothetical protein
VLAAYFVLAGMAVLLWVPILLRFYRNWVKRGNPISLSICAAVLLLMWIAVAGVWDVTGQVDHRLIAYVSTGCSLLVAGYANLTFYLARKKFDPRENEKGD